MLWKKDFEGGGYNQGNTITSTPKNQILVAGYSASNYIVFKLSKSGERMWRKYYSKNKTANINTIVSTGDGGFIVGGETKLEQYGMVLYHSILRKFSVKKTTEESIN